MGLNSQELLFVFDFDHTIVDCNTDTVVLEEHKDLYDEIIHRYKDGAEWTALMNDSVKALKERHGLSSEMILSRIGRCVLTRGMLELIRWNAQQGSRQIILSDANNLYIQRILQANGIEAAFSTIYTNSATVDANDRIHIEPFTSPETETNYPSRCAQCPPNLCKGKALEEYLLSIQISPRPRIIYIGDGTNDICPCKRLSSYDLACARENYSMAKVLSSEQSTLQAKLIIWKDGCDLLKKLTTDYSIHSL